MNYSEAVQLCPQLASPLALAHADTNGRYHATKHLSVITREFMSVVTSGGGRRSMLNTPPQHAKSSTTTLYGTAWALILFPWLRFVLVCYSDEFAASWGSKVRDVISRWGAPHGIRLKQDSKKKDEWGIEGHEGGMLCRGPKGGVTGRPVDVLLIDDLIKDHEQAMSPTIMESHWDWWKTSIFGRLRNCTSVFMIGTRWSRRDLFGRLLDQAKRTGEKWDVFKFKAIAEENDILGRKAGEALWPEQISLRHLEIARQEFGPWFKTVFQQEPREEDGNLFRPRRTEGADGSDGWPRFANLGNAFSLPRGISREIAYHDQCIIIVAVDWSMGKKKESDFTCFGAAALTRDGDLLILDCVNERIHLEHLAYRLEEFCKKWHPFIVASDDDMLSEGIALDCRRRKYIPEIRRLKISSKNKKVRATPAIIRGETKRIYLPAEPETWIEMLMDEASSFTGIEDEHDDVADMLGILGRVADDLKGDGREESPPEILQPARNLFG